jgi:hypothetical protein
VTCSNNFGNLDIGAQPPAFRLPFCDSLKKSDWFTVGVRHLRGPGSLGLTIDMTGAAFAHHP